MSTYRTSSSPTSATGLTARLERIADTVRTGRAATTQPPPAAVAVLSYAGTLTITVVADPDTVPDLSDLGGALRAGLATLGTTTEAVG